MSLVTKTTGRDILKHSFILFYAISNQGTSLFIVPILTKFSSSSLNNFDLTWIKIGIIFSAHELGKFICHFIWSKINKYYTNSFFILLSLILLSMTNFSFGFIKHFYSLAFLRFLLGCFNFLPLLIKNIYVELSFHKTKTAKLYIITSIASLISIMLPIVTSSKIQKIFFGNTNEFILPSLILSIINIITVIHQLILIKLKILKFRQTKKFIEMSNENDNSETIKPKTFSIKKQINDPELPSADRGDDKGSGRFNSTTKDDENYEKIAKRESTDIVKGLGSFKQLKSPRNFTMNNVSVVQNNDNNNTGNLSSINDIQSNKEKKYASIYVLMQINDSFLLIFTIVFLYIKFGNNDLRIAGSFLLLNSMFYIINFPVTKYVVRTLSIKEKEITSIFIVKLISIALIITLLIGVIVPCYFYIGKIQSDHVIEIIIIVGLFCLILVRNLLNSNMIQCYQIYTVVEFHTDSDNMRILNMYQTTVTSLCKSIFYFLSSLSYEFLFDAGNAKFFDKILSFLFFLVLPEGILFVILCLVKLYM